MSTAHLRTSVCDYLGRDSSERIELRTTLALISSLIPETVIFGGMLRQFAWGHARQFSSDIDLVSMSSKDEIYSAIRKFSPSINKFGGFRFIAGRRSFDIWSLEDTWAFRAGLARANGLSTLFETTFFGVDAAIFHLTTRRYEAAASHISGARERLLELNLLHNPAPQKMAHRTIYMALKWDVAIAPSLASYVVKHVNESQLSPIEKVIVKALHRYLERGVIDPFRFRPQISGVLAQDSVPKLTPHMGCML